MLLVSTFRSGDRQARGPQPGVAAARRQFFRRRARRARPDADRQPSDSRPISPRSKAAARPRRSIRPRARPSSRRNHCRSAGATSACSSAASASISSSRCPVTEGGYRLSARPAAAWLDDGDFEPGGALAEMAYQSCPRMALTGRLDGDPVVGRGWIDHQWGDYGWLRTGNDRIACARLGMVRDRPSRRPRTAGLPSTHHGDGRGGFTLRGAVFARRSAAARRRRPSHRKAPLAQSQDRDLLSAGMADRDPVAQHRS